MSFVAVGKVGRSHGIKGFVKIHSETDPYTNIIDYSPWYFKDNSNHFSPAPLIHCEKLGNTLIAKFKDCDAPEKTKPFVNQIIFIERAQLPALKEGEYYQTDLIGLSVYNNKNLLGKIVRFDRTGDTDIMAITNSNNNILYIPYSFRYILNINLETKIMQVEWDEI